MKRKVTELVIILLVYLIQGTFGRTIAIGGIVPNLLIILPVLFGFFKGKNEGMFVGFFAGIMYDLFFSGLFGFSVLVFVYVGYYSGMFYKEYEKVEVLIPLALFHNKVYHSGDGLYPYNCTGYLLSVDET